MTMPNQDSSSSSMYDTEANDANVTLFVGSISITCTDDDIREIFSEYGTVVVVRIQRCSKTGTSLGYGFLAMSSPEEAAMCLQHINDKYLFGRYIKVRKAGYGLDADGKNCAPTPKSKSSELNYFNIESPTYTVHFKFRCTHPSCAISELMMREIFEICGPIRDVAIRKVSIDKNTGLSCGYGFIHYLDNEEGLNAALAVLKTKSHISVCNGDQEFPTEYAVEASNNLQKHLEFLGIELPAAPKLSSSIVSSSSSSNQLHSQGQGQRHNYANPNQMNNQNNQMINRGGLSQVRHDLRPQHCGRGLGQGRGGFRGGRELSPRHITTDFSPRGTVLGQYSQSAPSSMLYAGQGAGHSQGQPQSHNQGPTAGYPHPGPRPSVFNFSGQGLSPPVQAGRQFFQHAQQFAQQDRQQWHADNQIQSQTRSYVPVQQPRPSVYGSSVNSVYHPSLHAESEQQFLRSGISSQYQEYVPQVLSQQIASIPAFSRPRPTFAANFPQNNTYHHSDEFGKGIVHSSSNNTHDAFSSQLKGQRHGQGGMEFGVDRTADTEFACNSSQQPQSYQRYDTNPLSSLDGGVGRLNQATYSQFIQSCTEQTFVDMSSFPSGSVASSTTIGAHF